MEELQNKLLEKLKELKGVDDDKLDDVFLFAIEISINDVLIYCNVGIDEWPVGLNNTVIMMAIDLINESSYSFNADASEGEVKSLTEGDFSISKETKAEAYQKMTSAPTFSRNYRRKLNAFRRLR